MSIRFTHIGALTTLMCIIGYSIPMGFVMKIFLADKVFTAILFTLFYLVTIPAFAIDNPDAPDYIGEFQARSKVHLDAINKPDNSNRAYLVAYDDYRIFLDKELNKAYRLLLSKLPKDRQAELKTSQRNWIKYRDAEFELIKNNWTRADFGSSAGISRGAYRCSVIKDRVIQLLHYVKSY